jgi:hypothetical protein
MTQQRFKRRTQGLRVAAIATSLALASYLPAAAQDHHNDRRHNDFYQGARDGGHGGDYNGRGHHDRGDYDNRGYSQGGIGPGKGAAV